MRLFAILMLATATACAAPTREAAGSRYHAFGAALITAGVLGAGGLTAGGVVVATQDLNVDGAPLAAAALGSAVLIGIGLGMIAVGDAQYTPAGAEPIVEMQPDMSALYDGSMGTRSSTRAMQPRRARPVSR